MKRVLTGQLVVAVGFVPQPASAPSDIPVGHIVDHEFFEVTAGFVIIPIHKFLVVVLSDGVKFGENPSIKGWAMFNRRVGLFWVETVQRCIIHVEFVDVPEGEEHLGVGFPHTV